MKIRTAGTIFERLRGLIGAPPLEPGEALLLPRCRGIHTFGMAYPIDAVFLDKTKTIVRMIEKMTPNKIGPVSWRADAVLELPSGTIEKMKLRLGDKFCFS